MDLLDLLAVQETLKSLLQHHSSKASILRLSAFFTVQLSHPYMTTGKTIDYSISCTSFLRGLILTTSKTKRTALAIQWLRFHASNAEGLGLIPGQGTKIPHVEWHGPITKQNKNHACQCKISVSQAPPPTHTTNSYIEMQFTCNSVKVCTV